MYQKTFTYLLTGCLLASLGASPLRAQFSSAVEGTVSDSSGAVIPNATVTLRNIDTGISQTTATSSTGYYRFPSLPASMFKLSATASGFKTTDLADFRLQIAETRTFNITLEVGTETTIVSVTDQPPLVETSEGRVSGIIESQKLVDLPLVGRNFYSLVVLTPGVTGLPTGGTNAYAQSLVDVFVTELGVGMNAGGNRAEQNRFQLDSGGITSMVRGGVTNVTPNAESVQELRVTVNNFSAENGTGAGANVTAITKSGTNDFHGSASWFYTGNKITARNVFTPGENPVFRRNEWTGAIGGPVVRNKTFFFASMDLLRSAVASSNTVREITPEFLALQQQLKPNNISTGLMRNFGSGLIPNRNFQTAGQIVSPVINCAGLPTPNTPIQTPIGMVPCNMNITGDVDFAITPPREGFQWNTRVDHNLTDRDRLYGSFYKNNLDTMGNSTRPAFRAPGEQYTLYGNLNYTHTFSPTLLNEAAMSYVRVDGRSYCLECQIPSITVTGLTSNGFGNGGPTIFIQNNFEWRDVLTWNRGGHSFKAGFTLNKWQSNFNPTLGYQRPTFNFQNIFDFANDDPISQGNIGFNPVTGEAYVAMVAERQSPLSLFVQDNWKVKSNLSVTLGLRWETFGVVTQPTGMTNVQWQTGNDFTSRIADGKTVLVDQIFNGDYNNFGPRVSFAWDPSRQGKMSIRGGYGIFFDPVATQLYGGSHFNPPIWAIATASRNTPPFVPLFALGRNNTDPYDFPRPANIRTGLDSRNGLLSGLVNATWIDPDMAAAYNHNYFFGIQYSLAPDWVVEANYVGTAGHKLYAKFNVNRLNGDLLTDPTLNRLNPSFGNIAYAHAPFNSSYHGGNVSLKKRFSQGLGFDAAYTFGKALDYMSGFTAGQPVDINDWKRARGLADFQVNHKLALSLTWYSPDLGGMNRAVRGIAGGWQVGAVTILQGGNPFTVNCTQAFNPVRNAAGVAISNSGCDYNADGTNFDVPHAPTTPLNTDFQRSDYITGLFPASAFPIPAIGQQGNLGRNTYFGPGYANTDISIMKNFKLPWFLGDQGSNLQFRGELYNLFNRVNLNQIQTNLGSPQFGRSTSARNGRYAQFGLRFSF